jgi:nucleoside-diphosphate-sugar epimerase
MNKEKFIISGASGFIGSALFNEFGKKNIPCVGIGRKNIPSDNYFICDLLDKDSLRSALQGVSCIIHCAGYAHAFNALSGEVEKKTWLINYEATKNLIEIAVEVGVSKFINLSSVKAMSEPGSNCVDEQWGLNPLSEYGQSKLAAEELIFKLAKKSKINVVNLRLVMVYGRGGHGNLERMAKLISKGLFPPLPETNNHRSMVHIDDVVGAIMCVASDSRAHGQTFILAGPEAPSGRRIYNEIRSLYGYRNISFEIPVVVLRLIANIFQVMQKTSGVRMPFNLEVLSRLLDSAWYSSNKIENVLNWKPKVGLSDGLRRMLCNDSKSQDPLGHDSPIGG